MAGSPIDMKFVCKNTIQTMDNTRMPFKQCNTSGDLDSLQLNSRLVFEYSEKLLSTFEGDPDRKIL
jgi:hypothetical protein